MRTLKRVVGNLSNVKGTNHKPYPVILFELFMWVTSQRGAVNVYFEYGLFLKGRKPGDYLKTIRFEKIAQRLNTPTYYPLLEDKYYFHQILVGQGFRIPRNLYTVDRSRIIEFDSQQPISEKQFLQRGFDGYCKIINGFGGKMIYRMEVSDEKLSVNEREIPINELFRLLGNRKYLIQERIIQHDEMNRLNPSCLNTLRILTLRTGQNINIFRPYLRIGINGNYVDNGISGNIMIGVNESTGNLEKFATSSGMANAVEKMDRHPQTSTLFEGFTIPYFKEALNMATSLHTLFQQFFMIGWDIGITPNGPIVIEGNNITDLYPFQMLYGGLKKEFLDIADSYLMQNHH